MTLTVGGITLSTFTNSRGQYNFYGATPDQGTVAVENQQFPVVVGRAPAQWRDVRFDHGGLSPRVARVRVASRA
jgi:hypothetical protein